MIAIYMYMYMKIHAYSTLAKLVVKEEKKENPDPTHHTRTLQTKNIYRTPGCPALRTGQRVKNIFYAGK